MPRGVYERTIKEKIILCHPQMSRHVNGICINCYSKVLKERNPDYKKKQMENSKNRYKKFGSKILNVNRTPTSRNYRIQAITKLGGKCVRCGYSDIRALHIDHVNGDGHKERTIRKTVNRNIHLGLTDISRYQLLCANCNWIKRLENNEGTNRKDFNEFMLSANEQITNGGNEKAKDITL